jgi:hypothetical protein
LVKSKHSGGRTEGGLSLRSERLHALFQRIIKGTKGQPSYRLLVPALPGRYLEFKLTVHGRKERFSQYLE